MNDSIQNDLKIETDGHRKILDMYVEGAKEWQEVQARYGQMEEDIDRKIGLVIVWAIRR